MNDMQDLNCSVAKICLDCQRVRMDGKLLGKANAMSSKKKRSFWTKIRDAFFSVRREDKEERSQEAP